MAGKAADLHLLPHLDALISCCSVSRAAEQMNISQPAMSAALSRLRKLVNDPLLVREDGNWVPTARALQLHAALHPLLDRWQSLVEPAADFDPRSTRRVFSMMATDYVQFALLGRVAASLPAAAPGLQIRMIPARLHHGLSMLESNDVELMAGYYPDPKPHLRTRLLFEEKLVCAVRGGHPALRRKWDLDAWLSFGQIDVTAHTGYSSGHIDAALREIGRTRKVHFTLTSYLAAPFLVAETDLVAVLPLDFARAVARDGEIEILEVPVRLPRSRISLYWHERYQKDQGHLWLRSFIGSVFRQGKS